MNIDNFSVNLLLSDSKNDLYIEVNNNNSNINFKYELFGNKNFYSCGLTKCKNSFIPTLKFRILDDNIFFLKIKIFNKSKSNSLFKFFNIDEYKPEENLSMSIEDLNKKNLLDSINLSNNNHDYNSSESDNEINIEELSDNDNNSDSDNDNDNNNSNSSNTN